jgi:hypothetical protein
MCYMTEERVCMQGLSVLMKSYSLKLTDESEQPFDNVQFDGIIGLS